MSTPDFILSMLGISIVVATIAFISGGLSVWIPIGLAGLLAAYVLYLVYETARSLPDYSDSD